MPVKAEQAALSIGVQNSREENDSFLEFLHLYLMNSSPYTFVKLIFPYMLFPAVMYYLIF